MIHSILLSNTTTSICLLQEPYFSVVHFMAAVQTLGTPKEGVDLLINVRLQNETNVFIAHLNQIPGTNQFNCFDVLEAAMQVQPLRQIHFHELEISIQENFYQDDFEITISVEIQ